MVLVVLATTDRNGDNGSNVRNVVLSVVMVEARRYSVSGDGSDDKCSIGDDGGDGASLLTYIVCQWC